MLHLTAAVIAATLAVFLKGLLHLSLGNVVVLFALPLMFLYKLLGNRPWFLLYSGVIAGTIGGLSALWAYLVVPTQYFHQLWGWVGILLGIVAAVLFPLQLILFFVVALWKGGAAVHLGNFFGDICFGFTGLSLFNAAFSAPLWRTFSKDKDAEEAV